MPDKFELEVTESCIQNDAATSGAVAAVPSHRLRDPLDGASCAAQPRARTSVRIFKIRVEVAARDVERRRWLEEESSARSSPGRRVDIYAGHHGDAAGEGDGDTVFFVDGVDMTDHLRGAIPKEELGADAVELEIVAAEAAPADAEGVVKAQISAYFRTAGECGRRRG
jgi:hypothetical protein